MRGALLYLVMKKATTTKNNKKKTTTQNNNNNNNFFEWGRWLVYLRVAEVQSVEAGTVK